MSEFKVGDKVWVQATVERIEGKSLRLTFYDDWTLWFLETDCRPVKPVANESLVTESNPSEIPKSSSDPVNPSRYKQGGIECIEAIKAALGDGFLDYLRGNVIKYLWRYKQKGGVDDLRKSAWYLDRLFKEVVKAKDEYIACYKTGKRPSEKLFAKLYRLIQEAGE